MSKEAAAADPVVGAKSSKMKMIIVILVVVLIAAGAGGGAAWFFLGGGHKAEGSAADDHATEVAADDHASADDEDEDKPKKKKKKKKAEGPPIFESLDPPFVVSFKAQKSARFMQLAIDLMSHNPETVAKVKELKPIIRSQLVLLFSDQVYEEITTSEGKDALLKSIVEMTNGILEEHDADADIEGAYFSSFVAQ